MADKKWTGRTGGTHWMQESLIGIFRRVNPVWVYPVVWIWILFYIACARKARRGIWHYWRRAQRRSIPSACWNLYLNYLEFGKAILDRFAAYSGRQVQVQVDGQEWLDWLREEPGGVLVLSSHIGNQELAGYSFRMPRTMRALSYLGDTKTVQENRQKHFEQQGLLLIPMQADGSHIFEMHESLQRGEILSVHADRLFYNTRSIRGQLFGQPADFPRGPFRLARAEQVPVLTLFMMRERAGHYRLYARRLCGQTEQELLQAYCTAMETMLRKYPRQWFHFYEFFE